MNNPTFEQARSLLQRWGYEPVLEDPNVSPYDRIALARSATVWRKGDYSISIPLDDEERNRDFVARLAEIRDLTPSEIRRILLAEPGQIRNLGTIEVIPQEIDPDYQGKVPHSSAKLRMDKQGRDRLIAALIEGCDQVSVYDEAGEGYSLLLESIDEN